MNDILELAKKLIKIQSTTDKTDALKTALDMVLAELPNFTIEKFEKDGISSAIVYNSKKRPKKFKVILNGHLDVIDGKKELFMPRIIGNKLYGIGSMDMKSNVACLVSVFKQVAKDIKYPIALQLVTDEQMGSLCGTKHQIDEGIKADFVIVGESTNFKIVNQSKGVIWLKVCAPGESAHSAYPWQGKNAILEMIDFIKQLQVVFPVPQKEAYKTTVNISAINTFNKNYNKIPDKCELWLDVRYIPKDSSEIKTKLFELIPKSFSKEIIYEEPPLNINPSNEYLKGLRISCNEVLNFKPKFVMAHGTSDATYYSRNKMIAVEFGPRGVMGNTFNEHVEIDSLYQYAEILVNFLKNQNK